MSSMEADYLGYTMQTVACYGEAEPGWGASVTITRRGSVGALSFPARGVYQSEFSAWMAALMLGQNIILSHKNDRSDVLSELDRTFSPELLAAGAEPAAVEHLYGPWAWSRRRPDSAG
jgi:hypothetical protein